jgi:hypothetical protein
MKRPSVPHLTTGSVYVGLTRVRRGADIRIWPMPITHESVQHLTKLRRNIGLTIWKGNYINGQWQKAGLRDFNKKKYQAALNDLKALGKDLLTKKMPALRAISKRLYLQHRNTPHNALLKTLQNLQTPQPQNKANRKRKQRSSKKINKKNKRKRKQKQNVCNKRVKHKCKRSKKK